MVEKVRKLDMIDTLRAEGWKKVFKGGHYYWNASKPDGNDYFLEEAYKIVNRRKRQREARAARNKPVTKWRDC